MKLLEQQKKKKKYQISMIENLKKGNIEKNKLLINKLQRGTIKNQNIFKLLMDVSKTYFTWRNNRRFI